ncbi:transposase family protein [Streptomyces sp. NBC_01520]|uniref:transposase family protein n=1 Tax=Streptomyces sp. NBC_01520 TaxID=2903892 RepID=UPI00386C5954
MNGVDRSIVPSSPPRSARSDSLLAARGFAIPDRPGLPVRTLDDLFAYADAEGVDIRLDGTEVQVRRPRAGRSGRKAFVPGKKKQNTIKTTTFSDHQGRTLFSGVVRPGRMHDRTAVRTEGIAEQFLLHPVVHAEADSGYQGLAKEFPSQGQPPPKKPAQDAPDGDSVPGARRAGVSHRPASWSNTPTPSTSSGIRFSATPDAARTTSRPTSPSPAWSPTSRPDVRPRRLRSTELVPVRATAC